MLNDIKSIFLALFLTLHHLECFNWLTIGILRLQTSSHYTGSHLNEGIFIFIHYYASSY